ncbi:MAG: hypothetical protein WCG27_12025, partial [Pseudomonadota bacterium]
MIKPVLIFITLGLLFCAQGAWSKDVNAIKVETTDGEHFQVGDIILDKNFRLPPKSPVTITTTNSLPNLFKAQNIQENAKALVLPANYPLLPVGVSTAAQLLQNMRSSLTYKLSELKQALITRSAGQTLIYLESDQDSCPGYNSSQPQARITIEVK